eukprot:TRINITY_DN6303_c0_g1_i1.p1 TRINITY_DN6303_c0_g1~~TRINITY_DN6303_c0_g1_i1.p1  ORF type:complete len:489 (-),score=94.01 TRINITY_DN6303_c0_g1_i1:24-1490(-)
METCPICATSVRTSEIDGHVNRCLDGDNSNFSAMKTDTTIPVEYWFEYITGTREDEWRDKSNIIPHPEITNEPNLIIKNPHTSQQFKAGSFYVYSLGNLKYDLLQNLSTDLKQFYSNPAAQLQNSTSGTSTWVCSACTFENSSFKSSCGICENPNSTDLSFLKHSSNTKSYPILEILSKTDKSSSKFVDVSYLQSLKENVNALFQVASNFNGVEATSEKSSPEERNFTYRYIFDPTQGPAASISAGAAAITRVHAPFYTLSTKSTSPDSWKQKTSKQVNFLENLSEHFPIRNGYVLFSGNEPGKFPENLTKLEWAELLELSSVGYHKDSQVVFGSKTSNGDSYNLVKDDDQVIDQVFCAAVNINQGDSGRFNKRQNNAEQKCKFILDSAYEGSYMSAIKHGKKKLFLTLIGGGAFGNNKAWIYEAILKAHLKWANHPASKLETVSLVLFAEKDVFPEWTTHLNKYGIPYQWKEYTSGVAKTKAQSREK